MPSNHLVKRFILSLFYYIWPSKRELNIVKIAKLSGLISITLGIVYFYLANQQGIFSDKSSWKGQGYEICEIQQQHRQKTALIQQQEYLKIKNIYTKAQHCIDGGICPDNLSRIEALLQIDVIKKKLNKAKKRADKYPYEIEGKLGISGVLGLPLFIIVALILGQKGLNNASANVPGFSSNRDLSKCFWALVLIAVISFTLRYTYTSIIDEDKIWYTSSSFCVRGVTLSVIHHIAICLSYISYSLIAAVMWTAASKSSTPKINLFHYDGHCGLYLYLRFWVLYIFAGLYFVAFYVVMWLLTIFDGEGQVEDYGTNTLIVSIIVLVFLVRIFWRMFVLKNRYLAAVRDNKNLANYKEVNGEVPEDPTRFFIGRYGEKALIFVFIVIIWIYKELGKSPLLHWLVAPFI